MRPLKMAMLQDMDMMMVTLPPASQPEDPGRPGMSSDDPAGPAPEGRSSEQVPEQRPGTSGRSRDASSQGPRCVSCCPSYMGHMQLQHAVLLFWA